MANKNEAKILFTAETGKFNDSIRKSSAEISKLGAELKLNETKMKQNGSSVELLQNKHDLLEAQYKQSEEKTEAINQKLQSAIKYFKEDSLEVVNLRKQLANAQNVQEKFRQATDACAEEIKQQKGEVDNANGGFTVMKGALADLASEAIQLGIEKISEFTSYLADLPEATKEFRQDMSTLETSFEKTGKSVKTAEGTWKDLYAVFGEDDRAVETANHIAKMADSQEELNDWVTITTGVWGSYQDSLPVEGLAEAAMETARTGKLTGGLTDAIVWAGVSEEDFQKKLDKCSNEQERQQLITDTLTKLYGDAAENYRDSAGAQMEAKEATAEHMQAEAELAEVIEPITTEVTELKTQFLEGLKPAMEDVTEVALDALDWMQEHPTTVKAIGAAVGTLALGLGALALAAGIYTAAQWAMNSALLANPVTWIVVGIVAAVALLVGAGVALYENWDKIKKKCAELWSNVTKKFNDLKTKVVGAATQLKDNTLAKWNDLKTKTISTFTNAKDKAVSMFSTMKSKVVNFAGNIATSVRSKFDSIKNSIVDKINTAKEKVTSAVAKIKKVFDFDWKIPKPKIPSFSVSGGEAPWGFGGKGKLPSVKVKWNKDGFIVRKASFIGQLGDTLMGAGEAGPEALTPISLLQDYINRAFEKNINNYAVAGGGSDIYNFYVNDAMINDNAQMREVAKDFIEEIVRLGGMNR